MLSSRDREVSVATAIERAAYERRRNDETYKRPKRLPDLTDFNTPYVRVRFVIELLIAIICTVQIVQLSEGEWSYTRAAVQDWNAVFFGSSDLPNVLVSSDQVKGSVSQFVSSYYSLNQSVDVLQYSSYNGPNGTATPVDLEIVRYTGITESYQLTPSFLGPFELPSSDLQTYLYDVRQMSLSVDVRNLELNYRRLCMIWHIEFVMELPHRGNMEVGLIASPSSCPSERVDDPHSVTLYAIIVSICCVSLAITAWPGISACVFLLGCRSLSACECRCDRLRAALARRFRCGTNDDDDDDSSSDNSSDSSSPDQTTGGRAKSSPSSSTATLLPKSERLSPVMSLSRSHSDSGGGGGGSLRDRQLSVPLQSSSSSSSSSTAAPFKRPPLNRRAKSWRKVKRWLDQCDGCRWGWLLFSVATDLLNVASAAVGISEQMDYYRLLSSTEQRSWFGVGAMLAWLRLLGSVKLLGQEFNMFWGTLRRSMPYFMRFFLALAPLFLGFVMFATVVFTQSTKKFSDVAASAQSLYAIWHGDIVLQTFRELSYDHPLGSQIFLYTFSLLFYGVVMRTITAGVEYYTHKSTPAPELGVSDEHDASGGHKASTDADADVGMPKESKYHRRSSTTGTAATATADRDLAAAAAAPRKPVLSRQVSFADEKQRPLASVLGSSSSSSSSSFNLSRQSSASLLSPSSSSSSWMSSSTSPRGLSGIRPASFASLEGIGAGDDADGEGISRRGSAITPHVVDLRQVEAVTALPADEVSRSLFDTVCQFNRVLGLQAAALVGKAAPLTVPGAVSPGRRVPPVVARLVSLGQGQPTDSSSSSSTSSSGVGGASSSSSSSSAPVAPPLTAPQANHPNDGPCADSERCLLCIVAKQYRQSLDSLLGNVEDTLRQWRDHSSSSSSSSCSSSISSSSGSGSSGSAQPA